MTSIIGIKVSSSDGVEGIVLGSDTQLNIEDNEGKFEEKRRAYKKIIHGKTWALAHAGDVDKHLDLFYGVLVGRKRYRSSEEIATKIIYESVSAWEDSYKMRIEKREHNSYEDFFEKPHFKLVNLLNSSTLRFAKVEDDEVSLHSFILATCPPKIGLWYVNGHGILTEVSSYERDIDYLCMGSGGEKCEKYITGLIEDEKFDPEKLTIPSAIDLVNNALHRAELDIYTGGPLDLAVLTNSGVDYYGDEIRQALVNAEREKIESIKSKYS